MLLIKGKVDLGAENLIISWDDIPCFILEEAFNPVSSLSDIPCV